MSSYSLALTAAKEAAGSQHYPAATLYVVATPIGNLADIGLRALQVMQNAHCVACEDTRHTQQLWRCYGLDSPPNGWLAVHQHNEAGAAQAVLDRLAQGQRVVYVSDAGTPAISDPGARLVQAARAAGYRVMPIPGASSVTTALSAAGLDPSRFVFVGFLPAKGAERDQSVQDIAQLEDAQVLLEAPHRILALTQALSVLGQRRLTLCRELTKQHEQIETLAAQDAADWLKADADRTRGEFVLVVHPQAPQGEAELDLRVLQLLLAEPPS